MNKTIFEIDASVLCYVSVDVALKFWQVNVRHVNTTYR